MDDRGCGSSEHGGPMLRGEFLRWERQSVEHCQCDAREEGWKESRTLGGMRVERPRLVMKLILTAMAQLASIAFSLRSCLGSRGVPGRARRWSGDGGRAVGGEVREESCKTDYAGALFAKQPPQLHLNDITEPSCTPHRHHDHHVCPAQVNWITAACACPEALGDEGYCPLIPRVLNQRIHSTRTQDELRGCARS